MKVGDLVVTTRHVLRHRLGHHTPAGRIGVITYWALSGAYVLFTEDGREIWFEDDELTAVATTHAGEED